MEFNDEKLITMFSENDEDAKNILYDKYSYIISIILAKYKTTIYALGIDISEVKQEAMLAFTDALIKYSSDNLSLSTSNKGATEAAAGKISPSYSLKNSFIQEVIILLTLHAFKYSFS